MLIQTIRPQRWWLERESGTRSFCFIKASYFNAITAFKNHLEKLMDTHTDFYITKSLLS